MEADEIAGVIQGGEMPTSYFILLHYEANLTTAEQEALIRGLMTVAGGSSESD